MKTNEMYIHIPIEYIVTEMNPLAKQQNKFSNLLGKTAHKRLKSIFEQFISDILTY